VLLVMVELDAECIPLLEAMVKGLRGVYIKLVDL